MNFLLPDVFGSAEDFDSWFNIEEKDARENVVKRLHSVGLCGRLCPHSYTHPYSCVGACTGSLIDDRANVACR